MILSLKHRRGGKAKPALMLFATALAGCAARPLPAPAPAVPPPLGDLTLDVARPIVMVIVDGVPLRLMVDPGQWDVIELNPDVAHRLAKLNWVADHTIQIGRVSLLGRTAITTLTIDGRTMPTLVAEHGRVADGQADGVIGPDLLSYATIHWQRAGAPAATDRLVLPLAFSAATGFTATPPALPLPIRLRLAPLRPQSEATAAAGSLLAQRYGGEFDGPVALLPVLFGIDRPTRPMRFGRPPLIAGFRIARISVRISDFRGGNPLPEDRQSEGEIVVKGADNPQPAQSWVTLGADRLSLCREIVYRAEPRSIELDCAFDR